MPAFDIDNYTFDIQEKLSKEWAKEHPNGKLPDGIAYLLSEVRMSPAPFF